MGTRGLMGFVVDEQVKATYNHFDSYPSALGAEVGKFAATLRGERLTEMADKARAVTLIDEQVKPTAAEQEKYAKWTDVRVSEGDDWYAILRHAQGNLGAYLDMGIMPDNLDFAQDSLFCEWAYLINFDTGLIEIYRGFQQDPDAVKGRFANGKSERGYTSITLLGTLPFTLGDSETFWVALEEAVYAEEETAPIFAEAAITA
jgi:hypothetical protein